MDVIRKIHKVIKNPRKLGAFIMWKTARFWNDETFLRLMFYFRMGRRLDIKKPILYNDKLQWLKMYYRRNIMTDMVDKYKAKEYAKKLIGTEYIIPTLGVYESVDDIDFATLPNQFVLKCTHDSGGLVVCKDKMTLDIEKAKKKMAWALNRTYYYENREWPYKNVKRAIIAEKYMEDESGYELKDYKFFCFDGIPHFLFVATDRPHDTKFDFFDLNWNHLPFKQGHPNTTRQIPCPKNFEKMIELASKLSKGFPHVRVDLYNCNGKIYFGEMTFYHYSGMVPFCPAEWDAKFGKLIKLPAPIYEH